MELSPDKKKEFIDYIDSRLNYILGESGIEKEASGWSTLVKWLLRTLHGSTIGQVTSIPGGVIRTPFAWRHPIKYVKSHFGGEDVLPFARKLDDKLNPLIREGGKLDTGNAWANGSADIIGAMLPYGIVGAMAYNNPNGAAGTAQNILNVTALLQSPGWQAYSLANWVGSGIAGVHARRAAGLPVTGGEYENEADRPGIAEHVVDWVAHPKDSAGAYILNFIRTNGITAGPHGFNIPPDIEKQYPDTCAELRRLSPQVAELAAQAASAGFQGILDWIHSKPYLPDFLTTSLEGFFRNRVSEGLMGQVKEKAPMFYNNDLHDIVRQAVEKNINGYENGVKRSQRSTPKYTAFTDTNKREVEDELTHGYLHPQKTELA